MKFKHLLRSEQLVDETIVWACEQVGEEVRVRGENKDSWALVLRTTAEGECIVDKRCVELLGLKLTIDGD